MWNTFTAAVVVIVVVVVEHLMPNGPCDRDSSAETHRHTHSGQAYSIYLPNRTICKKKLIFLRLCKIKTATSCYTFLSLFAHFFVVCLPLAHISFVPLSVDCYVHSTDLLRTAYSFGIFQIQTWFIDIFILSWSSAAAVAAAVLCFVAVTWFWPSLILSFLFFSLHLQFTCILSLATVSQAGYAGGGYSSYGHGFSGFGKEQ